MRFKEGFPKEGQYIICSSESEADILCSMLHSLGLTWSDKQSLSNHTFWERYNIKEFLAYFVFDFKLNSVKVNSNEREVISSGNYVCLWDIIEYGREKRTVVKNNSESIEERKENVNMNMFGFDFECGLCEDKNISSTILGVAVKNGDSWRVFDKSSKTMIDIGDMQMWSFPIYILPSTKINVGDTIKQNNQYLNVTEVSDTVIQAINFSTGKIENIIPVKNIFGMSFYSKIMVLTDDLMNDDDGDNADLMLLMFLTQNNKVDSEDGHQQNPNDFFLLWMLMSKDKDDEDDNGKNKKDKLKKAMMLSMAMGGNNGNNNGLMMYMFMKDKLF